MKSFFVFLGVGLLVAGHAQSQNQSTTNPTSTTTSRASVRPPTTSAASPNRQQELYDQYHGITKKPAGLPPAAPTERQASRPASQPAMSAPVDRAERPASLDGSTSGVRIGIRGGITRPVYLEKLAGADPAVGFVGGFVFNFGKGALSFQPELNYARYMVKGTEPFSGQTFNVAGDRFEVPLFLKIASGSVDGTRLFLNVGPYATYVSSISLNGQKTSLDGATGRFGVGAAAGVGVALKAGPGHFTLELRGLYELGTTDTSINTDSKVINTQATVGYMFPLGGNR